MKTPPHASLLVLILILTLGGCAKSPTRPVYYISPAPTVDSEVAWSHDGQWIAFRRGWWSSYGPPGLYVISAAGGTPRLLMRGDFFFPRLFSFSPDDRHLIADGGFQIVLIDVATGANGLLFYAETQASYPDWSPDGRSIVYFRLYDQFAPIDSAGVRVFDISTRVDRRILVDGGPQGAISPLWTSDGKSFVGYEGGLQYRLVMVRVDGTSKLTFPQPDIIDNLRRYSRPSLGVRGFVFVAYQVRGQLFINEDGTNLRPFPWVYRPLLDFISWDGLRVVSGDADPVDSLEVLFVHDADDVTGASRRQLTYWDPPSFAPYMRPSSPPHPPLGSRSPSFARSPP